MEWGEGDTNPKTALKEALAVDQKLKEAVESLLADIEEMETDDSCWYGPFSTWEDVETAKTFNVYMKIEWPNLALSTQKVR